MIFRQRPAAPACLTEETTLKRYIGNQNQIAWGLQYADKRANQNKRNDFKWATYKRQKVNQLIEGTLKNMTQNHCAFCDGYPVKQLAKTIEHFEPKTMFPEKSHLWTNLFYCCFNCQNSKLENYSNLLLKPDLLSYSFERYFIYRADGEAVNLHPNPRATENDQRRAKITIDLYGLNEHERPEDRFRVWRQFNDSNNPIIDEFPYRFLFL